MSRARQARRLSHHYVTVSGRVDRAASERVQALAKLLLSEDISGITDVIPGYNSVLVEYDTALLAPEQAELLVEQAVVTTENTTSDKKLVEVGVVYDGPDLPTLAGKLGMSAAEIVRRHSAVTYHAYATGFAPGFTYLGDVDPAIRQPRLDKPRALVPAGSVGIADSQTGIYPLDSPGGWNIIGRAVAPVYDPARSQPSLIHPGNSVRFVPLEAGEPPPTALPLNLLPLEPKVPALRVRNPGLLDLIVDQGRYRAGHLGFVRSGALDPVSAQIARGLVANRPDDPVLEVTMLGPTLEALTDCVIAFAGSGVSPQINGEPVAPYTSTLVTTGQVIAFPPAAAGCRGYLAVAGGFDSGTFMGSTSVDTRGLIGRALHEGDVLGLRRRPTVRPGFSFTPHRSDFSSVRLRLLPGPQYEAGLVAALTARKLRIEHADRVGVRLTASSASGGGLVSEGNPLGAVQLTPGGEPLILLNDRGTMGGYMKPAIVDPRDLPLLAQARVGAYVRFVTG